MSRLTLLLLIIIFMGLAGAVLAIVVTPKRQVSNFPQKPSMALLDAQSILTIGSSPISSRSATSSFSGATTFYSTDVVVDTGGNKITAVQLELSFNPNLITRVNIKPGSFFKNPVELLNRVNNQKGTISFALGNGVTKGRIKGVRGKGTVATIYFEEKGISGEYAQINFLPKTLVLGEGTSRSVLKSTVPAVFPIGGQNATGSSLPAYSP